MTDEAPEARRERGSGDQADAVDHAQPAEGGRAEVADLPGADTDEGPPGEEDDRAVD